MKIKMMAAVGAVALAAATGGMLASSAGANASGTTLQTVTKSEVIISPKCYHMHQVTKTYYHWSKTHYVLYAGGPRVTVTDQNVCHA
jgi:hypothetical protein